MDGTGAPKRWPSRSGGSRAPARTRSLKRSRRRCGSMSSTRIRRRRSREFGKRTTGTLPRNTASSWPSGSATPKKAPRAATAYYDRGILRQDQGELDQAIGDFTRTIEIDPRYAEAYCNRGLTWARKGDLEKAIGDFGRAIEAKPAYPRAFYNRGLARWHK